MGPLRKALWRPEGSQKGWVQRYSHPDMLWRLFCFVCGMLIKANFVQVAGSLLCRCGEPITARWQNKRLVKFSALLTGPAHNANSTQAGVFKAT